MNTKNLRKEKNRKQKHIKKVQENTKYLQESYLASCYLISG